LNLDQDVGGGGGLRIGVWCQPAAVVGLVRLTIPVDIGVGGDTDR